MSIYSHADLVVGDNNTDSDPTLMQGGGVSVPPAFFEPGTYPYTLLAMLIRIC
jgi:hypothetical protein